MEIRTDYSPLNLKTERDTTFPTPPFPGFYSVTAEPGYIKVSSQIPSTATIQPQNLWKDSNLKPFTGLVDKNGNRVYMVGFIDDHSRLAYGELHDAKGCFEATKTLENFIYKYGMTKLVQTDNRTEFTNLQDDFL